ncbi:response regulator transcription factor [Halocynthiibacter sp.]|uniref:response regulator transcription factor n=1 Tax=Halocynthiibacter sp. TaxID=1979210 RepID=UPI003C682EFC
MSDLKSINFIDSIDKPAFIFAGQKSHFSDMYLQLVQTEFRNNKITYKEDLDAADQYLQHSDAALVIISCSGAAGLAGSESVIRRIHERVHIAVAYETPSDIHRLSTEFEDKALLNSLSYLPMNRKIEIVMSTLALIAAGEHHIPCDIAEGLIAPHPSPIEADDNSIAELSVLTPREEEVLSHLAQGTPNKVIAHELSLSESTVKLHIHHVISKLGVHNRTEAALIFHKAQGKHLNQAL